MGIRTWYNGYKPSERDKNYEELKRQLASGELSKPKSPCALCGDPGGKVEGHFDADVVFEYHNEDYSLPLKKTEPALFVLCHHCHVHKLHRRFESVSSWNTFLAHVRRGGYARDLKDLAVKRELQAYRSAAERGEAVELKPLGPYTRQVGGEWFAKLRLDEASLTDPAARPTP